MSKTTNPEHIYHLRCAAGVSLAEVSANSGISVSTLIRLEKEERRPVATTIKALAVFYRVPVASLMDTKVSA